MLLVSGSTATVRRIAPRWPGILGQLLTPSNRNRASVLNTGLPWGADNGAFSGFDADAFRRFLGRVAGRPRCLWVVCPDRVGDARETLRLFAEWREEVARAGPVAFVGQDGAEDLEIPWDGFCCWFVGGSTAWKLSAASQGLMAEARARGKCVHVGRVNSFRRLTWAYDAGADSVDGSSASMWGDKYVHAYCRWIAGLRRSPVLFGGQA
jgi:hypothetical protein